jgi:hypothetical protein
MPSEPVRKTGLMADLLCGIGNLYWDLARILSAIAFLGVNLLAIYRASQGEIPTLSDYASANLQVLTGCAIFIGGKDLARSIATKGATAP